MATFGPTAKPDEKMAMRGASVTAHAARTPLTAGYAHERLRDVTNQNNMLSGMGWRERRRYVNAERLDRIVSRGTAESETEIVLTGVWHAYRDRWHRIDLGLRPLYNYSIRAYYRDFRRSQEFLDTALECGMQAYTKLTQRLERGALRKDSTRSYVLAGRSALDAFGRSLVQASMPADDDTHVTFVSLDFEGDSRATRGVTGFGATTCDPRLVNTSNRPLVETHNFKGRSRTKQNFIFGHTTRIDGDDIRQAVIDAVTNSERRKIVLVGHGLLSSELRTLERLDITLDDLNVVGLIDTSTLAQDMLRVAGSLESLLQRMQIDYARSTLHCAGNDAYYTMQVLFALLEISHFEKHPDSSREGFAKVMDLVKRPIPARSQGPRKDESAGGEGKSADENVEDDSGVEGGDLDVLFG